MKAYRFELKRVPINEGSPALMDYREGMLTVCTAPSMERGISTDDVIMGSDIKRDMRAAKDGVLLLSPEHHAWCVRRLKAISWGAGSDALGQFIRDLRDAPQVDVAEAQEAPVEEPPNDPPTPEYPKAAAETPQAAE